ncbi:hypothetical protein DFP94_103223 [Fontibacillus phaseoli]|uniref:Heat induced stress protein YflT n=1 Tax=Fontibacillus phaseoli TaxID=1416533 RepID=A0A369BG24_9BACL|nr:hypothetical protein [Fontibacillus phaseoli]RCX20492.1 hypothetical protein DFP94_103223 [Fontibacillus phaseoli]
MAKLLTAILKTRHDAAMVIEDLIQAGVKKGELSVVSKTEEALGIISRDAGLSKPERGDGNHALFHPLIEIAAILEEQPANVAAVGPAAKSLAGAEIGMGSDDFIVGLIGAGIPEKDARLIEESLLAEKFVVFVECEDDQVQALANIISARE